MQGANRSQPHRSGSRQTKSPAPPMRRICRHSRIHFDMQPLPGHPRRVTVTVARVVGTVSRNVRPARRLRELPQFGEPNPALGGARRTLRKTATGRGRTGIVDGPVHDAPASGILTYVFSRDDVPVICSSDTGAINPGPKSSSGDAVDPGIDVSLLLGQHASALLLI